MGAVWCLNTATATPLHDETHGDFIKNKVVVVVVVVAVVVVVVVVVVERFSIKCPKPSTRSFGTIPE